MKKLLSILLVAAMAVSLAACGGSASSSAATSTPAGSSTASSAPAATGTKGKIAYIVGNLGDKSFSDSGQRGIEELAANGWETKTIETGDSSKADKYNDYILDAIDEGYQYIVASSTYVDNCLAIAKDYPDVKFVIFDTKLEPADMPANMTCIFYAQIEGSYLVGMMAAAMSTSKVVAVDVGMDNPVIADFVTGYINGVQDYDPTVKVVKAAVGSWSDPAKMKELCLTQARDNKADVFYQVAGGSGDGLFEACASNGTWAIGVDSDQYAAYKDSENPERADVILTSMLKEVGNSFVSIFGKIDAGEDVWQKTLTLGLADNSVGYVDNAYFEEKVPEDVRAKMEEAKAKIASGEGTVKSYYDFKDDSEYEAYVASVRP